jgi:aspartate racemase
VAILEQKLVPGLIGISTYVDYAYQKEMQLTAIAAAGTSGPINQLRTVTVTLDFNLLVTNLREGRKAAAEEQVAVAARALAAAGSDFIVVTSGTTSTLTARARESVSVPFLDIAEACLREATPEGPIGLLCTSYTTAGGLFHAAAKRRGATLIVSPTDTAERVDQAIFGELIRGETSDAGLRVFHDAIEELTSLGAASIILGNTDLTLVADILQKTTEVPLIDSARAHARNAAHAALAGQL